MLEGAAEDDFARFLDLGSEFQHFEALDNNGPSSLDTPMGRLGFNQFGMDTDNHMNANMDSASPMSMVNGPERQYAAGGASQQSAAQKNLQLQMPDHRYQIPLTPVSSEMNAGSYLQHVDGNGYVVYERNQVGSNGLLCA